MILNTDYKITIEGVGDYRTWYIDFNGLTGAKPVPQTMVLTDYEFYLARRDIVILDSSGNITVNEGQADNLHLVRAPNHTDPYTLVLGTVVVYPNSTTTDTVKSALNRLSMADLQKMKTRIDNLEYNNAVNALDQPAMQGVNPVLLRGVFSDGFISMDKYDNSHPDSQIAFSFEDAEITLPWSSSTQYTPTLVANSPMAHSWGRLITAPFDEVKTITQSNATETMNVNPYNTFNIQGILSLTPSEDNWIEEDRITVTEEETSTLNVKRWWKHANESWADDELEMIQNIKLDEGQSWFDSDPSSPVNGSWTVAGANTGTTLTSGGSRTIQTMIEYMRQIDVQFEATNIIPNSNNLVMQFDGVRVPITPASGFNAGATQGSIMSNAQGVARGTFKIPAGIRTGIREVTLSNGDNTASTTFIAQGTLKTTEDVIIRTRVTINMVDPLAQSFQFNNNHVISSVGLHFASKDASHNVTVQIRGISEGGQPNRTIYAESLLSPSQINVSDDGSAETRVYFDDPIVADGGKDYCVVLLTDVDTYTMWIATRGQNDIRTGATLTSNPYLTGVLYSSSNARAWTAHQDSDLKFSVYTAEFNDVAVLEFNTIENIQADSIVLMATYLTPANTGCAWELKMVTQDEPVNTDINSKAWLPIANYLDIDIGTIARQVKIRATFRANDNMSPLLSSQDITFNSFLSALQGSYIARTIDMQDAPFNTVRFSYEAFEPQGATVTPRFSTDNGVTWREFSTQPTTSTQSNQFTRFVYEEQIAPGSTTETSFKARLDLQTQNSFIRSRARRLMINLRDE